MLQKGIVTNIRLTAGDQDVSLGAGTWNLVLFIRSTSVTVTGTVLGRPSGPGVAGAPIDVLATQIIDSGAPGTIADGTTAVTGNKMVRFLSGVSSAVATNHLAAMDSTVTLVDAIRITIAPAPVALVECTLVATRVA